VAPLVQLDTSDDVLFSNPVFSDQSFKLLTLAAAACRRGDAL